MSAKVDEARAALTVPCGETACESCAHVAAQVDALIAAVREDEREANALVCDDLCMASKMNQLERWVAKEAAERIRARRT